MSKMLSELLLPSVVEANKELAPNVLKNKFTFN